MDALTLTSRVLKDPMSLVESGADPNTYALLVPRLLGVLATGAAVFGATVGSYRGGAQIAFAAAKAPLLLVVPLIVVLPAVAALAGAPSRGRLALAGLVGMTRTAVLAAAMGPILWLLYSIGIGYHSAILLLAGSLALAGLPGLWVLARALPLTGLPRAVAVGATIGLTGLVGAQTGWLLRPFVARPTAEVALFRPVEADAFDALDTSAASAVGSYGTWEVQPAGAIGELTRSPETR